MKTSYIKSSSLLILVAAFVLQANGQDKKAGQVTLQKALDARHYVFVAQTATPLRDGMRQLTSYYDLTVSADTVISNLPYFGQAYVAPMNPSEGGLAFTSVASDYRIKTNKKGTREISIKTKSGGDAQRMQLTVFNDGTASLQVTSNNRDAISFNGYVREVQSAH